MTHLECECEKWEEGFQQIIDQAVFCQLHSGAPRYTAGMFAYCPWCGEKLMEADDETEGDE